MWRLAAILLFLAGIFAVWANLFRPVTAGSPIPPDQVLGEVEWEVTLEDISPRYNDQFGYPAPMRNDTVFSGVPGDDDLLNDAGAVRVFSRNEGGVGNWGLVTSITPEVPVNSAEFGSWVAVDGSRLLVGASREYTDTHGNIGAAYIFEEDPLDPTNWTQTAKLTPSLLDSGMQFGAYVALAGDTAVVGAPNADISSNNSGAVFVFERDPSNGVWSETAALLDPDPDYSLMGQAVATDGDLILAGAQEKRVGGLNSAGQVLVFARNPQQPEEWMYTGHLESPSPQSYARFGSSVALHPDLVVVGARFEDRPGGGKGNVYVYERVGSNPQNWPFLFSPVPEDDIENYFGNHLAIHPQGDRIMVGAIWDYEVGYSSGAVYIFDRDAGGANNWGQVAKIIGLSEGGLFGAAVQMNPAGTMAISERFGDVPGFNRAGALHIVCLDDDFEPNDDFGAAAPVSMGEYHGLQVCSGDADYYAFNVPAGDYIWGTIDFSHAAGNLDMTLYGPDFSLLAESTTMDDGETILYNTAAAGTHYLQVWGVDQAANRYDLALAWEPSICSDDPYEENDDFASAADIPFGVIEDLTICPADEDYFRVSAPEGVDLSVAISFTHDLGDLNLALYDAGQMLVMESTSTTDNEAISFTVPAGGMYYIHVYGVDLATNQYDLEVKIEAFNYLPWVLKKP